MAKVDSMATSLIEIKAMFQARQHSKHWVDLPPKELVYETPRSTTQMTKQPSSNVLKEMATILVPSMVTFSSTPLTLQFRPSIEVNKAKLKVGVESTTPKAELD